MTDMEDVFGIGPDPILGSWPEAGETVTLRQPRQEATVVNVDRRYTHPIEVEGVLHDRVGRKMLVEYSERDGDTDE